MPSNVIQAMRYEPRWRELLVVFRGGRGTYRYFHVAAEEWRAFLEAESKGMYLNEVFKRKVHPYIRLMEPVRSGGAAEVIGWRQPEESGADRREETGPLEWGEVASLPRRGVQSVGAEGCVEKIRA